MPLYPHVPRIVIDRWTRVPKKLLVNVEAEKSRLTIPNRTKIAAQRRGFASDAPDNFLLYQEDKHFLYVPRAHAPQLRRDLVKGKDYIIESPPVAKKWARWQEQVRNGDLGASVEEMRELDARVACYGEQLGEDNIELGPNQFQPFNQEPAFQAMAGDIVWPWGKVIALRCGAGKTVIGLKAAHYRGGNMLWVVHSTSSMEDMFGERKGIPRFLGIPADQILRVQGSRLKKNWPSFRVGVAMLHSLSECEYPQSFYDHWDFIIFDEGDLLGAQYFCRVVPRFSGERVVLTATPKRADGMEVMYQKHVGPVVYQHLEHDLHPDCYFVHHESPTGCLIKCGWDTRTNQQRVSYQATAKALLMDDRRNAHIFDLVRKAAAEDRNVLVLGDSVEGLAYACQGARAALPQLSHGLIVGQVPQKERDAILQENRVVWATSKLGYRGLDKPTFDTAIVATLITAQEQWWTQLTGRILRFQEGKPNPVVAVIADVTLGPLIALCAKLDSFFQKSGWKRIGAGPIREANRQRQLELRLEK